MAIDVFARLAIIDAIAVADVETELGAEPPNGVLHPPRADCRKFWIERTSVDLLGSAGHYGGAATGPVARRAIGVIGAEPAKDPGAMQKIVH